MRWKKNQLILLKVPNDGVKGRISCVPFSLFYLLSILCDPGHIFKPKPKDFHLTYPEKQINKPNQNENKNKNFQKSLNYDGTAALTLSYNIHMKKKEKE